MQSSTNSEDLSGGELSEVLRNVRRRYVVYYLKRGDGAVDLNELVRQVAAWEEYVSVEDISKRRRKSVYSSLRQTHLPKLEDIGILTYDPGTNAVELTEYARALELRNEPMGEPTLQWSRLFVVLSALSVAVGVLWTLGVHPLATVDVFLTTTTGLLSLFSISTLAYTLDRYWGSKADRTRPDFVLEFDGK